MFVAAAAAATSAAAAATSAAAAAHVDLLFCEPNALSQSLAVL
jgi:hypothetical protein